jgi:hypothetical protein
MFSRTDNPGHLVEGASLGPDFDALLVGAVITITLATIERR